MTLTIKKNHADIDVENYKAGTYWDVLRSGLHLDVGVKRKTWRVKYRQGDKQFRPAIGYFPAMGLAAARLEFDAMSARLDVGAPVRLEQVEHPRTEKIDTLGDVIDKYETWRRLGGGKKIKSLDETLRALRKELEPYLKLPVKQFSKADLKAARDGLRARGKLVMANRFLAYTSKLMNWGTEEDHFAFNFCSGLEKTSEKPRTVKLNDDEMRAVWRAAGRMMEDHVKATRSFGRLIRFLLCVPGRKMEAAKLRIGDINAKGYWVLTEHKTAEGKDEDDVHMLLLPQLAQDQLGFGSKDIGNGAPDQFCFPGRITGKALSGWSRLMIELRSKAGIDKHFTIHDLRRTAASRMQKIGVDKEHVDMVLNHALTGISGTYMQDQMTDWKADALVIWNRELERVIANDGRPALRLVKTTPVLEPMTAAMDAALSQDPAPSRRAATTPE